MGRRFFCFSAKSAGQISEGIAQQVEGIHLKKHKKGRFKMKKSLKMISAALVLSMGLGLTACGNGNKPAEADPKTEQPKTEQTEMVNVGIIQYMEHGSLDQAREGFIDAMAENGFTEGENVTYDFKNAQSDQSNLQTIAQRFVGNNVDLICAIATPAAQTVANSTGDIPIVATAVTDYAEAKLVDSNEKPGHNVTGVSDMVSISDQIDLLLKFKADAKAVGVIYSSNEVNSELQAAIAKDYITSLGLEYVEATVTNVNDIQQAAQSLLGKIDVLYVPTDNTLASAIPTLVQVTDEASLPIVTGATSMVSDGALATVGIDYYKLGKQTGVMAAKILKGEAEPASMPIETANDTMLVLNKEVADRLGITVPEDIMEGAQIVGGEAQ